METERRTGRVAIEERAVEELRQHMLEEDERQRVQSGWHVGREIPLALILAIAVQTIGVVIWAVSITQQVTFIKETAVAQQIVQTAIDRKQDEESQRSENRVVDRLDKLSQKIDRLIEGRWK